MSLLLTGLLGILILFICLIPIGVTKHFIHGFMNFVNNKYMWLYYAVYYTIVGAVLVGAFLIIKPNFFDFQETGNRLILYTALFSFVLIEGFVFYRYFYKLEDSDQYGLYLLVSNVVVVPFLLAIAHLYLMIMLFAWGLIQTIQR